MIEVLSRFASFALANTILQKEKPEEIIKLSSSSLTSMLSGTEINYFRYIEMISTLPEDARENLFQVMDDFQEQLNEIKACIAQEDWNGLEKIMEKANNLPIK